MNPEIIHRLHDTERVIATAFERAKDALQNDAIEMADFQDLYGQEQVAKDLAAVGVKEAEFAVMDDPEEKDYRKLGLILEAIIHEQSELSDWLGPSVATMKTSRYDDIFNGVDGIFELVREDRGFAHLAFGVDVTYSVNVKKKLARIRREDIQGGALSKVKYFASSRMRFRGELSGIPRVVVGLDRHNLYDVVERWTQGSKTSLNKHPVGSILREQIRIQLHAFAEYAAKIGHTDTAAIYAQHASLLEHIIREQPLTAPRPSFRDEVDEEIKKYLGKMLKD